MDDFFLVGMSGISVVFVVLPLVTICAYSQCLWCQGMSCNSKREMRDVVVDCRLTHLDGEDDLAAVAGVLALHGSELADGLVLEPLRLEPHHRAALRPAEGRSLVR